MRRPELSSIKNYILQHKFLSLLAICVIGVALALGIKHLSTQSTSKKAAMKPIVHTQVVARRPLYNSISLFGQLKAKAQIDIVNKYAGIVDEINVDLGSKVKAGDVLLVQRLDDARAEMLKAQARYAEAGANAATTDVTYATSIARYKADYQLAQVNAERYRRLYAQGAVSKSELDAMEQTLANKKAQYEALSLQRSYEGTPAQVYRQEQIAARREQEYLIAQNKYHDLIFKAPRDGIITYRDAEVGGYAPAGSRLLTLLDDSGFTVDCDITEAEAAAVAVGTEVELKLEAIGEICRGTVVYVSPVRSRETNKFTLRIRLLEPDSKLKAGLFAKGELQFLQKPSTIYLPKNAVLERDGKFYVYVLGKGNKVTKKLVTTGASNNESLEIVQGLKVGDIVVVDNLARLRDGMVVDVAKGEAK